MKEYSFLSEVFIRWNIVKSYIIYGTVTEEEIMGIEKYCKILTIFSIMLF